MFLNSLDQVLDARENQADTIQSVGIIATGEETQVSRELAKPI